MNTRRFFKLWVNLIAVSAIAPLVTIHWIASRPGLAVAISSNVCGSTVELSSSRARRFFSSAASLRSCWLIADKLSCCRLGVPYFKAVLASRNSMKLDEYLTQGPKKVCSYNWPCNCQNSELWVGVFPQIFEGLVIDARTCNHRKLLQVPH